MARPLGCVAVASADYPDPLSDWFKRHRVKLALLVFAFIMLGRLPQLLEGTVAGVANFVYGAAFFGLLTWGFASRKDRWDPGYWRRLAIAWTTFLAVQIAMVLVGLIRGNDFQGRWLVPIVIVALLAGGNWFAYRRSRGGDVQPAAQARSAVASRTRRSADRARRANRPDRAMGER